MMALGRKEKGLGIGPELFQERIKRREIVSAGNYLLLGQNLSRISHGMLFADTLDNKIEAVNRGTAGTQKPVDRVEALRERIF